MKLQEEKEALLKSTYNKMMAGEKVTVQQIPKLSQVLQWFKARQIKFTKEDGFATRKIYSMNKVDILNNKQSQKNK